MAPFQCRLCGGAQGELVVPMRPGIDPTLYTYWRCQECGVISLQPLDDWSERSRHYTSTYRGYYRREIESSLLQRLSMAYGLQKRLRLVERFVAGGRLVDIGCGGGDFVNWSTDRPYWTVFGLERVPAMAAVAAQVASGVVTLGDALHLPFAENSLDAVLLWTVIEHLDAPLQGIRECLHALRPGGVLLIRTLNSEGWGKHLFGPHWLGFDAPRITTLFSPTTLQLAVERCGADVIHIGAHFHDFYPYLWCINNICRQHWPAGVCDRLDRALASLPVRLLLQPFLMMQTATGKNSFFVLAAHKRL